MKKLFFKKLVTSILFILFLFIFSVLNLKESYMKILNSSELNNIEDRGGFLDNIKQKIIVLENSINDNFYKKYKFIDSYGYMQRMMDKYEENNFEVIKDKDKILHYTFFADKANNVEEFSQKTKSFKQNIRNRDIKFIYIMPPDKYIKGRTIMEKGLPYNYANETADNFLQSLNRENIDFIDLRSNIEDNGSSLERLFFKTDHHWTIETAFNEFVKLVSLLKDDYDLDLNINDLYTDYKMYNFINYEDSYIGSMGRKTGKYYSGIDDFTLIYPKFNTSYDFYANTNGYEIKREGRFEDTLINTYVLNNNKDIYSLESDKYNTYLFGNQGIVHITNNLNKNGKKILIIKDSYMVPLSAFLSTTVSDLYLIDPRYYDSDIVEFSNKTNLDAVFISFSPQDLTKEFFKF